MNAPFINHPQLGETLTPEFAAKPMHELITGLLVLATQFSTERIEKVIVATYPHQSALLIIRGMNRALLMFSK